MRALALIYSHRSLGFRKPQLDSISNRKEIQIPKGKPKSVCRSTGWSTDPCPRSIGRSSGPKQRAACFSRSTGIFLCTLCTPVDCPVDRSLLRLTGRSTEVILSLLHVSFLAPFVF